MRTGYVIKKGTGSYYAGRLHGLYEYTKEQRCARVFNTPQAAEKARSEAQLLSVETLTVKKVKF